MSQSMQHEEQEQAPVNWSVTAVLGLTFLAAITVVPWYGIVHGYSGWAWAFFGIFTYEAHPLLKWFLAVMGGMSLQNSIIVWSARHRVHHRDVDDNDRDPYSIGRGFWFAHIGWMLNDYASGDVDYSVVRDLERAAHLPADLGLADQQAVEAADHGDATQGRPPEELPQQGSRIPLAGLGEQRGGSRIYRLADRRHPRHVPAGGRGAAGG